jgi:hypothetical protein
MPAIARLGARGARPSRSILTGRRRFGGYNMADANPVQAGTQQGAGEPQSAAHQRAAWILTGYGIFGLAVISLIAYTVAQYAVR